ncbi:MAG: PAS domain S-box protein [Bacteroidota bacterium]
MTLVKLALVFIGVGGFFMLLALLKTRNMLAILKDKTESKSWRVLFFMMLFFLAGYVFSIYFILQNQQEFLILLTGIVFLFGALFVFMVTGISFFTINDLLFKDKTEELNKELEEERKQLENRVQSRTSELIVSNIKLQKEIEENKKAQHELAENKNRLQRQNHTLHILTKKLNIGNGDFTKPIHELTEIASETMETERISVWLYNELKTGIRCIDAYERSKKKHTEGEELNAENYPVYFKAIELDRVIDASDARKDPRTYEYFETYLKPLGITSLLDAPIRKGGLMIGIVCFEQDGPPRTWTIDEQLFAGAIADSISILLESIERIKAEKAFQEKEQLLSSIYDTVGDIIFVLSVEKEERYKFVSINKTFVTTTGLNYDQVVGKYVDEIIPQPSLKIVLEKYKKAILEKKIGRWEEVSDYPTGQLIGEVSIVPIFDEKGNSTLLVGAVHDITDRKNAEDKIRKMSQELEALVKERTASLTQAQESLKFSEEKYRKIVEEVGDVVYSSDYKGYLTYINPMSKKITGYTENELIGKYFTEIIDPEWKETVAKFYKEQFDNKIRETLFSFPIIAKTGEKKWVEQTVIQQREGDKITGHQAILRDITDRKKIEVEIKQKSEELIRSNQELEQFAYVASHDLQEPLRTISNFVGLLEKTQCGKIDDDANNYLNFITSATLRMQILIKDLLDYSRVGKSITFSIIDCNNIFKEVLAVMDASIKESHAKITSDVLPKVKASDVQLKQLFQNLISNSIKFRKKNSVPEIKITVEEKPAEYLFAVKDNGIGIEEKYMNKLFILFQRLHTETEYPGTGIGLAICKKIVTLHGGKIWAESKLGEGSTFYFTLPKGKLNY